MILLQYAGAFFGIVGMGLLSLTPSKVRMALAVTAFSCVLMGSYGLLTEQYGIAFAQTVYLIFNIIGLYSWRKVNVKSGSNKEDTP